MNGKRSARSRMLETAFLASVSTILLALSPMTVGSAWAQEQPQELAEEPEAASAEEADQQPSEVAREPIEEIIITGSRIRRQGLYSQVPVASLEKADVGFSGEMDISVLVQEIPALFASTTTEQSAETTGINTGLATLDLRSLGSKRTLVLVDGRRHVGGRAGDTAVDINTIPTALIERVEVSTGGASAVYGADAVSGVVNIITKKQYEGLDAEAYFGISDKGDAAQTVVSVIGGSNFAAGKGNATFSVQYRNQNSIKYSDRDWSKNNAIYDDHPNPALFCQQGETDCGQVGDRKYDDPPPNIPARLMAKYATFAISSKHGRIGVDINGDGWVDGPGETPFFLDVDGDGINDIGQTYLGRNGFGDWIYDSEQFRLFNEGLIAGFANQFGGDGIEDGGWDWADMTPQTEHVVTNGSFRYALHPSISFFAEAKFVHSITEINGNVNSFNDTLTVSLDNPYMPGKLRTALEHFLVTNTDPSLANPQVFITRDMTDMGISGAWTERNTFRTVAGFEGELDNGWFYEISVNFGRTSEKLTARNQRIEDRYFAAIDAVTHPVSGQPVCRSDLVPLLDSLERAERNGDSFDAGLLSRLRQLDPRRPPPTSPFPEFRAGFLTFEPGDGQCKPMNLFGSGSPSQESIDFVTTDDLTNNVIEQQVVLATLTGDSSDLFELPAGPIDFAVGFEYRREASSSASSAMNQAKLLFASGTQSLRGHYDVWEGFAEISIPVLADLPAAEELTIEGAVRLADYNTIGTTTTWQARGSWAPIEDFRLRGSVARAIRAPNISELFQTKTLALFRPVDPCEEDQINSGPNPANRLKNCREAGIPEGFVDPLTGRFEGLQGGNAGLKPEIADSVTVGGVFTPTFLPGFALTVDYWNIDLEDAIEFPTGQDIVDSCYDAASLDNPFCDLIRRDPVTHGLNYMERQMMNIAARYVRGIDFRLAYKLVLADLFSVDVGTLSFAISGSRLLKRDDIRVKNDPSSKDPELGEVRRPKWAGTFNLRWYYSDWALNYQLRWIGNQYLRNVEAETAGNWTPNEAGNSWIHDLQVRYRLLDSLEMYAGVNNLFDRRPFINQLSYPVSAIGRFFYFGMTSSFN